MKYSIIINTTEVTCFFVSLTKAYLGYTICMSLLSTVLIIFHLTFLLRKTIRVIIGLGSSQECNLFW